MNTHVTWSNKYAKNVHKTQEAIESTAVIDILEFFVLKDSKTGMWAVLKECSYNKEHNFNLLSMPRLLLEQSWKIMCGDKSLICIENGKGRGGVINFDIIVSTEKGTVHACKFVQETELASVNMGAGTWVSVNIAHCLLRHRKEDSM
jgi:hypothetical protein